jgi:SNF2 family DNA or RNA helicase
VAKLEDLKRGALIKGILPSGSVTVIDMHWHGSDVVELTYKDADGKPGNQLLLRDREPTLEVEAPGTPWAFDSDGEAFRLVSEAFRIHMAYLFDPWLAVHISFVEPLPHQITAVYGEMLPRQPLRFLLADDPGSGKTIMAGLLIKELMLRGDLERCLIVAPGNLAEQWQDELDQKFNLPFDILTTERIEAARTRNPFAEAPLLIARLDKLSRDETLHPLLSQCSWDLIVVDEAHKMSASLFGNEIKYTKRFRLGQLLSGRTRQLLLLTATPHNGKEEDFQLFLSLIDADRFEGRYRKDVHTTDASDLMRRLVKEQLLKFDGKPLFPERRAYTVGYQLSPEEAALYAAVTTYVREEFDRADDLEEGRRGTVGFALTILQRRLASSPDAIFHSLRRRRERLESRLREEKLLKRGAEGKIVIPAEVPLLDDEAVDDLDDAPDVEFDATADQVADQATAARTIAELEVEISTLRRLEGMADAVRRSGKDRKWTELAGLLSDRPEMFDTSGSRRKLVIFTEHKDTLSYLADRIRTLLGRPQAVVTIHGSMRREERRAAQQAFVQDKSVQVLVGTDAAGEGINLQRAHLMVNYDLPWNPARIEQRFGRIHRIGQTEVCHLWNLMAQETREGDVFHRLFEKIEEQRRALGGGVFDILGKLFQEKRLRDLLIEAVRYGDRPDVRARLMKEVDNLADRERCRELLEEHALARDSMDVTQVQRIRQEFERAQARRLQPHFIAAFFKAAFTRLGGSLHEREPNRYEVTHVPGALRERSQVLGVARVLPRYERVTFHKELAQVTGKPVADFLCPGHPLLDAVIDITLERNRALLRRGAILVDPADGGREPRLLVYMEHSIQDGRLTPSGDRRIVSRQMQFVEMDRNGSARAAGPAPFLSYEPLKAEDLPKVSAVLNASWLKGDLEGQALSYAAQSLVPTHFEEVKRWRLELVAKTEAAVRDRLAKEIAYWDHRAQDLLEKEKAGRVNARLNSEMARRRADDLQGRLQRRLVELEAEKALAPLPPVLLGGAIVVPAGLLRQVGTEEDEEAGLFGRNRGLIEQTAMAAVLRAEEDRGFQPKDVSAAKLGWDVESTDPAAAGRLRFIEVKGRIAGAKTVTVTKNEILACRNKPDDFLLALVEVDIEGSDDVPAAVARDAVYIRNPFRNEPDFAVTSVNYDWRELAEQAE